MQKLMNCAIDEAALPAFDLALDHDPPAVVSARSLINLSIGLSGVTKANIPPLAIDDG